MQNQNDSSSYSYYDDLRKEEPQNFVPIFNESSYVGRNLHRYHQSQQDKDNNTNNTNNNNEPVVLCHTPVFVRYTKEGKDYSAAGYGSAAGAMMAVHHWNNGIGSVVKEIEGIHNKCPIRFTTEIFDTQANAVPAVKGLTDMMIRVPGEPQSPQPCAIVGTIYSSVSTKFAITSGVYDLLQVSPGASSDALDDRKQYPLFARTHPADSGSADLLPKYLKDVMKVKNFAIVYIADDGFGLSYLQVVQKYAKKNGMNTISVPISLNSEPKPTNEQIKDELKSLVDSELNYIIGVFFFDNYNPIMEAAAELGVAGPGKFWFFAGTLSDYLYENAQEFDKDSVLAKATYGSAIITDGGTSPTTQYDNFLEEWKKMGNDTQVLDYINSKQPVPPMPNVENITDFNRTKDFFDRTPNHIAIYSYEAIIGIGLAACQAREKANSTFTNGDIFSGQDHHEAFLDINFTSASGRVVIGPTTYSRNESSTYFVVANILEAEPPHVDDTKVLLKGRDYAVYYPKNSTNNSTWKYYGDDFIYSDGLTVKPPQIPGIDENMNLISNIMRASCLILCSISIATSIGFLIFTKKKWKTPVIRLAQPIFLILICVGTSLMAVAIVPLSMDDGVAGQIALDASCSLTQWFFSLGFTITFAALFSKLWRTNRVLEAAHAFRRVTITVKDVLKPFAVLSICNAIILSVWQWGGDRPKWERTVIELDSFDRVVSSSGSCSNHGVSGIPYFVSLVIVNGIALVLACHQAYLGRNTQTELNESKYIGMTMICICECCFFALPLLFISGSNRSGMLFVITSLSFVICISTLLFIFVPKILRDKTIRNRSSTATNDSVPFSVRRGARGGALGQSTISGLSARAFQIRASQLASGGDISQRSSARSSTTARATRRGTFKWNRLDLSDDGKYDKDFEERKAVLDDEPSRGYLENDDQDGQENLDFLPEEKSADGENRVSVSWQRQRESDDTGTSLSGITEEIFERCGDSSLDSPRDPVHILSHVSERSELS